MNAVAENALAVSAVVAASLMAALVMRRRSAAFRHWILAAGVLAAATMPAVQVVAPRWGVPRSIVQTFAGGAVRFVSPAGAPWTAASQANPTITSERADPLNGRTAVVIWVAGAALGIVLLLAGLARLVWIASRARPLVDPRWIDGSREMGARLGLRRTVAILQSAEANLLLAWGLRIPRIILPSGAETWSDERIRVVLLHELSHIRRRDPLLHTLASLLRAVYWFNPLIWVACRWLRYESERASDDDVVRLGVSGPEYATALLEIARTLQEPAWAPAPAMARPSSLERRVRAMLSPTIDRRPLRSTSRLIIAVMTVAVAVSVVGSGAAAQVVGSAFSGSFVDGLNNAIPNVTLTLRNNSTGEQYTVKSDDQGRFALVALPDGDYQGEVNAAGFTTAHPFFSVRNGRSVQPTVVPLALGSIEETVTVRSDAAAPVITDARSRLSSIRRDQSAALVPPSKVRDVRPAYPPNRTDDDATVFLQGIIDTNGLMKGLQVMQPANGDFARAAFDAVNDWKFEPTRLHGVPVDTAIHVTVRFLR